MPDPEAVDVIATLAHEFRTPIASLRATVEALVADREILSAEQTVEMLSRLQRGTVWLQGFVENFLSSVSLDAQQLSIRRRPVLLERLRRAGPAHGRAASGATRAARRGQGAARRRSSTATHTGWRRCS